MSDFTNGTGRRRANLARAGLLSTASLAALLLVMPNGAGANPTCSSQSGVQSLPVGLNCPGTINLTNDTPLLATTAGDQINGQGASAGIGLTSQGAAGSASAATSGGNGQSVMFTNNQQVVLDGNGAGIPFSVLGIASRGGQGASLNSVRATDGGAGGPASALLNATGVVGVEYRGRLDLGGSTVSVGSFGGRGGAGTNGHSGGHGGNAGTAALTNRGLIQLGYSVANPATGNLAVNGALSVVGAWVRSVGGDGGSGGSHGANGGNAGSATITSSGQVNVLWSGNLAGAGLYGVRAQSQGGAANAATKPASGDPTTTSGGNAGTASVSLESGGTVTVNGASLGATPSGAAVAASAVGGAGARSGGEGDVAGFGGAGGGAAVTATGATITAVGTAIAGVTVSSAGGAGGDWGDPQYTQDNPGNAHGGDGGHAGVANATLGTGTAVSTDGVGADGVVVSAIGGAGGDGAGRSTLETVGNSGLGGFGGAGGTATANLNGTMTVTTRGDDSIGVLALSIGGDGGDGGLFIGYHHGTNCDAVQANGHYDPSKNGGCGGDGAAADAVAVTLGTGVAVETFGDGAMGVAAQSLGGAGGGGGGLNNSGLDGGRAGDAGDGGDAGMVFVTTLAGAAIVTHGDDASAIVARSLGGVGGTGGSASNTTGGSGGHAGSSGDSAAVSVTNGGAVTTYGDGARGILAIGQSGAGGSGGTGRGSFYSSGGGGGAAGQVGDITVQNTGTVATHGEKAAGIVAQSIGGAGGAGGATSTGILLSLGGTSPNDAAASGGKITVGNGGAVTTAGDFATGISAQSIGGGGGDAGNANGLVASVGGSAGGGGDGGAVRIDGGSGQFGSVSTIGDYGHGLVAQSIGGGGGTGGNASGTGAAVTVSVGGSGGSGGDGSEVEVALQGGSVKAIGSNAIGILGQSIGGGGGTGGGGYATAVGPGVAVAVAVGGSGGDGGDGGGVTIDLAGTSVSSGTGDFTFTNIDDAPVEGQVDVSANTDAYGIVAQTIGGGGGTAGSAAANAISIPVQVPGTDTKVGVEVGVSVGGSGGSGGDATGPTTVNLHGGASVTTGGQGSHGVILQSIGGGGGNGGDSSAMATLASNSMLLGRLKKLSDDFTKLKTIEVQVAVAVGGAGGVAGDGGAATFTLGDASGAGSSVETFGDMANGVLLQSIGGGGGNAGFGSGTTKNYGSAIGIGVDVGVGGSGGSGGDGGAVSATIDGGSTIETHGENAYGLVAQSIGGGGGTSQGVTVGVGLSGIPLPEGEGGEGEGAETGEDPADGGVGEEGGGEPGESAGSIFSEEAELEAKVQVGKVGGAGGDGGTVALVVNGIISTLGNGAGGIVAQSIGGGGGIAGGFGSEASADNPVDTVLGLRKGIRRILDGFKVKVDGSVDVTVGAGSSKPSHGGTVTLDLTGATVRTLGDHAQAVLAQSVGGGGGIGASATTSCGESFEIAADDVPAGVDGPVYSCETGDTDNMDEEAIEEGGSFFDGIVAQGIEKIQTVAAQSLVGVDVSVGGSGQNGGNGGAVTVTMGGTTIETKGLASHGVFAQSIGGGGGIGGDGSDVSEAHLSVGANVDGSGGSAGNGGAVTIRQGTGLSTITTAGEGAHAVFAQSVGGSGGQAIAGNGDSGDPLHFTEEGLGLSAILDLGGGSGSSGNGGKVSVGETAGTLNPIQLSIKTTGLSAFGILAQSIGGGGGLAASTAAASNPHYSLSSGGAGGDGGDVLVYTNGNVGSITTSGAGAHGILAQSVGGGGGIAGYASATSPAWVTSLPASVDVGGHGKGGAIDVESNSQVSVTGDGAFGILAQSIGGGGGIVGSGGTFYLGTRGTENDSSNSIGGTVKVVTGGAVSATGRNAVGIFAQSTDRVAGSGNAVTINVTGSVKGGSGDGGYGVYVSDGAPLAGGNKLTIGALGSVSALSGKAIGYDGHGGLDVDNQGLVTGSVSLTGALAGTFGNSGTFVTGSSVAGNVSNAGHMNLGGTGTFTTTSITGTFTQAAAGTLQADVDFAARQADLLTATSANLAGTLEINATTLNPGVEVAVLTATNTVTGTFTVTDTAVIDFDLRQDGKNVFVSASGADFSPVQVKLSRNGLAVADHLNAAFAAGGSGLGELFARANALASADPDAYAAMLNGLAPGASHSAAAQRVAGMHGFGNALMSCPTFEGSSAMLVERECGWAQVSGRTAEHGGTDGASDFGTDSVAWQLGGQIALAPNWFIGGAVAYEKSWLSDDAGTLDSDGDSGLAGVALKYQQGPWLLSGAVFGAYGSYDTTRVTGLPGNPLVAGSSPDVEALGARFQAVYTLGGEHFYLRPGVKLDEIYVRSPGYAEKGAGALDLVYETSDHTTAVITPTVELGGRLDLSPDTVLRGFVNVGVGFLTDDEYEVEARFAGAPAGSAPIRTTTPIDDQVLRIGTGVQLTSNGVVGLRLQYDGEFADELTAHAGSVRVTVNF